MQAEEARRDELMSLARKEYEKSQKHAVNVPLQFQDGFNLDRRHMPKMASSLAAIVLAVSVDDGREINRNVFPYELPDLSWPDGVAYVSVDRSLGQKQSRWFAHNSEWAGKLSKQRLQERINEKSGSLRRCDADASVQDVLFFVLDGSLHSSIVDSEVPVELFEQEFISNFNKAFVWFHSTRKWRALRLRPRSGKTNGVEN